MDLTLIIFAALALFLSYRLFNVLGTRGGHEPDERDRPILRPVPANDGAEAKEAQADPVTPREDLPEWARTIREETPGFEPKSFIEGASAAYEMIVEAYANGDLSDVRRFIDPAIAKDFELGIKAREDAGQRVELTFVGIETPEVVRAYRAGEEIRAEVKFISERVHAVLDADGNVVEGHPENPMRVAERWVFARPVRSRDPNWTLVQTYDADAA